MQPQYYTIALVVYFIALICSSFVGTRIFKGNKKAQIISEVIFGAVAFSYFIFLCVTTEARYINTTFILIALTAVVVGVVFRVYEIKHDKKIKNMYRIIFVVIILCAFILNCFYFWF